MAVALGYGDPATWGSRKPYDEIESKPLKLTQKERKKRSDVKVSCMIADFKSGKLLSTIFHGHCASVSDRKRFFYECRKRGVLTGV